jgi:hypothetical protein
MVPTVQIVSDKHPQGWVTLNLSDYDPLRHVIHAEIPIEEIPIEEIPIEEIPAPSRRGRKRE